MAKNSNNVLALGVGLNLDPLNQDIANAAKTAKDGMATIADSIVGAGAKSDKPLKETKDKLVSLSAQLRQARLDAQQLSQGGKELGDAFQASVGKAAQLKDQIQAVDQAILANSTTMNNVSQPAFTAHKTGFNGMAMSINQLTREMPAFTYSMQTGFMAISNNIPMFVDQINMAKRANMELAASGQPVKSVFGQVASSIFSWQTLMGVGITLLTVYGAKIFEWITAESAANVAIKKSIELEKQYQEVIAKSRYELVQKTTALKDQLAALQQGVTLDEFTIKKKEQEIIAFDNLIKQYQGHNDKIRESNILKSERLRTENALAVMVGGHTKTELEAGIVQEKNTQGLEAKVQLLKDEIEQGKIQVGLSKEIKAIEDARKQKVITTKYLNKVDLSVVGGLAQPQMQPLAYKGAKVFDMNFELELLLAEQGMETASLRMQEINQDMWTKLKNIKEQGLNNVFGSLGEALGSTIAKSIKGENVDMFGSLRDAILMSIADMAMATGSALIAAGSLAKGLIKGGSKGSVPTASPSSTPSLSSSMGNNSKYIGGQNSGQLVIEGYVRGNDINFVNGKSGSKNNRNLRFG